MLALLFALCLPAQAYVYWTPEALVADMLPGETPTRVDFTPDAAAKARLEATLGYPLPRASYPVYVGATAGVILDDQRGQHEPIDFGVLIDRQVTVRRVEILVYREAYGDAVKGEAFRKQFVGLGLAAPLRPGRDIRIVSGATISTRSIAVGVKRALALMAEYWKQAK
jgi:hypothetical protein